MNGSLEDHHRKALAGVAEATPGVLALYLFGSRATGRSRPESDVDLAILLEPGVDRRAAWDLRRELIARFEGVLGGEVDLAILGEDLDLSFRVLTQGDRLYERRRDRVRFEESLLAARYYDFQPFLHRYLAGVAASFRRDG